MSTYGGRGRRNGAACRGFYLLVFYILIANWKASDICVQGGGVGGKGTQMGWGGCKLVLLKKEITLRPFLKEGETENGRWWWWVGGDVPCVLVNPS